LPENIRPELGAVDRLSANLRIDGFSDVVRCYTDPERWEPVSGDSGGAPTSGKRLWYTKFPNDAWLRNQAMTDIHVPEEFAVDTVRNLDAWYAAFDVKPGEKLYLAPIDRVGIW